MPQRPSSQRRRNGSTAAASPRRAKRASSKRSTTKRAALTLSLPRSLIADIDRIAHRNFTSRNALINHAVRALVATLQQQRED